MTDKADDRMDKFLRAVAVLRDLSPFHQTLALHAAINWNSPEFVAHIKAVNTLFPDETIQ
jgi:hypothetical protein